MVGTLTLSKPIKVINPHAYKPTILNLHPNNVTILTSSISGGGWQMLRQEIRSRDHLPMPTRTMGLSGPDPEVGAITRPMTRMCMCWRKKVPSWRSLTLEYLKGGIALSDVLAAKRARPRPLLLDDAESKFREILSHDRVDQFTDIEEIAWRMEMIRKEEAAFRELKCYIDKCEGSHEKYEANLILVEMLIYLGHYEKARQTLEERLEPGPTDYRPHFYLAVICVLLCEEDEAKKHWNELNELKKSGFGPIQPKTDDEQTPMEGPAGKDDQTPMEGPAGKDDHEFNQFKLLLLFMFP